MANLAIPSPSTGIVDKPLGEAISAPPRIAVAGVSGFAGGELSRLLLNHPRLQGETPVFLGRAGETEVGISTYLHDLHPQLATAGNLPSNPVLPFSWDRIVDSGIEVLFLATPHEQSREWAPEAIERGIKVIDLSGAWRLQETRNRDVYRLKDADPKAAAVLQSKAKLSTWREVMGSITASQWPRAAAYLASSQRS